MRVIGIDLDEVLAEFLEGMCSFHNERYGTSLSKEDFFTYDFWNVWGGSVEEAVRKVHEFHETDIFRELRVCSGAVEGVNMLKEQGFGLFIVTSRQKSVENVTKSWVERNFPGVFSDVFFSNNFSLENTNPLKKSELCREIGASIIVEDQLAYAGDCAANGISVVLLDKPWNQGKLIKGIKRVYSWEEAVKAILS